MIQGKRIRDDGEAGRRGAKRRELDHASDSSETMMASHFSDRAIEPSEYSTQPYGSANEDYTIGWICALLEELEAACRMLDDEFDGPDTNESNDNNTYVFGRIGKHNVVIGCLPAGRYGTSSATSVAKDMVRSFPNLRFALMVGIGGGAPTQKNNVRLGDVVVSVPQGKHGGVVQYDFGKRLSDGQFQQTGQLDGPPIVLLGAVQDLRRRYNDPRKPDRIAEHIALMEDMPNFQRPEEDRLYCAGYIHQGGSNCNECGTDRVENRSERATSRAISVHYGIIASANSVMKDAIERDRYANDPELNVLCFEMEAGGLMNFFPCLVIRGICDYSDSHKNDEWHNYAALAAAAYTRELLHTVKPQKVTVMSSWAGKTEQLLSDIWTDVVDVSRGVNKLLDKEQARGHDNILNWLTSIDYDSHQNDYTRRRQAGTGQWLLESPEFQAWVDGCKKTLFCPGIPGAGKTILTSIVVNELKSRFGSDKNTGIAHVYCNFGQQDDQKAEDLLASLLRQLCQGQGSLPESVKSLYDEHRLKMTRPSIDDISRTLRSVAVLYSKVFIVIDALDECQTTDNCRANVLSELFNLQTRSEVNIFATSRFIPDIIARFDGCPRIEIYAAKEDVHRYLEGHMEQLLPFVQKDQQLQDDIKAVISDSVDGMFLLVKLYLSSLEDKITPRAVKRALKRLQRQDSESGEEHKLKVLTSAYDQVMERINGQMAGLRHLALEMLSWITYARRLLTTSELQHALAVEIGYSKLGSDNFPAVEDMVSVCAGLVTVDKESKHIQLCHYTAQEYFVQKQWFPNAQRKMTDICTTYLSFHVFGSGFCQTDEEFESRLRSNVLYEYAARNWGHHAREAPSLPMTVLGFLERKSNVEASSQALISYEQSWRSSDYTQHVPRQMTGLHLASFFGVGEAVSALLNEVASSSPKDSYDRTPLWWAARNGHATVVKMLLDAGETDVDMKDHIDARTALSLAAECGHEDVVRLLLTEGKADSNSTSRDDRTPLSYAAAGGHTGIVAFLFSLLADIDGKDDNGWTPLTYAAARGHGGVVQLFLGTERVDADSKDDGGRTPLSYAAEEGHNSIVKLLLRNNHVDPDSKATGYYREGRTPLSYAAENGYEDIVNLLLATGNVDVNSINYYSWTPLSYAEHNSHGGVVKALQATGQIDANGRNYDYCRPPSPPKPKSLSAPGQEKWDSVMAMHSLQIPSCFNPKKGDLVDFSAQIICFLWFESIKVLEAAEKIRTLPLNFTVPKLTPLAVPRDQFRRYVRSVLSMTQVSQNVIILALLFLHRLDGTVPTIKGNGGSEFRLYSIALMLANKILDDNVYTNKTWAEVSCFPVKEVHIMEVEFVTNMRYNLFVSKEQWEDWLTKLGKYWEYCERAQRSPADEIV